VSRWDRSRRDEEARQRSLVAGQLRLGEAPPVAARAFDPDTSVEAAKATPKAREHRSRLAGDIYRLHQLHPGGLTDDELDQMLVDDDRATIARRRRDLVDQGLVEATGDRRRTRRGATAVVWVVAR
jgi:hypothetical protein